MFSPIKLLDAESLFPQNLPLPVVHFKGFGRYINFKNNKVKKSQSQCMDTLYTLLENGGTLIWDGDSYNTGSFTFIIPLLFDQLFRIRNLQKNKQKHPVTNQEKQWLFLACLKEEDTKRFTLSWQNKLRISKYYQTSQHLIRFELKPLRNIKNFIDLGIYALSKTESKICVCFGGGYVVKHEYNTLVKQCASHTPMPTFYVFDVGRYNKSTGVFEDPALKSFTSLHKNIVYIDDTVCVGRFKKILKAV